MENKPLVYHVRRLALNTTIHDLHVSNSQYVIGSIAVIITSCQQNNAHYHLNIMDGENIKDTAIVSMLSSTYDLFDFFLFLFIYH